jgi:hypothetical protein
MALLDDLFKGNPLTGVVIGIGAYLLAPTIGPVLRPAAKAVIKAGILAYQGLAELGELASDLAAEAHSELDQPSKSETEPTSSGSAGRRSRPTLKP